MRIDKWLWAARIYKTRSLAAAACRNGKATVDGHPVKPSREIKINDLIIADNGSIKRTIKVLGLPAQRVGASAVKQFMEDLTPASEYEKAKEPVLQPLFFRPKAWAGPRKKTAVRWEKLEGSFSNYDFGFIFALPLPYPRGKHHP